MDLQNIGGGTPVTLKVKKGNSVADFETEVIAHVNNCLVCTPMLHEEKLINFAIPGCTQEISIFDKEAGRMYAWRNIEVKAGYYRKTTLCHLIYLNSEPLEVNRRSNYRQYVGITGTAIPFHRPACEILIRDVSNNGIGFIYNDMGNFDVGRKVVINFSDCDGRFKFSLRCEIVRYRELEDGRVEFGCGVIFPPQTLANYVAHKQLEERKKILGIQ